MNSNGKWRDAEGRELETESREPEVKPVRSVEGTEYDPLWTPEQVARRLNVSPDWVRDHSSRKEPRLPVIRLGGGPGKAGLLRYRASRIEKFIEEMEHLSSRSSRRI